VKYVKCKEKVDREEAEKGKKEIAQLLKADGLKKVKPVEKWSDVFNEQHSVL
jgi:hypothetical protein